MNGHPDSRAAQGGPGAAGFTILELSVVMGLLAVFMMFLLQIVFTTTELFQDGQADQERSAHSLAAVRPVEKAIRSTIGPTFEARSKASDARLLVHWVATGFNLETGTGELQALRSTVRIPKYLEKQLRSAKLRAAVEETIGDDPQRVAEAVEKLLAASALRGRGEMLLLPWPHGDADGAFFDLRRAIFLPDEPLPFREADGRSLLELRELEREFPPERILANTEVVAQGLLHLSYRLASQYTVNWTDGPDGGGPERVWDSARRGWFAEGQQEHHRFSMDLGDVSRNDSTDDVYPHYIEATVVAGGSPQDLPEALLAEAIDSSTRNIRLINTDSLPATIHDNFVKIGSEWVQFSSLSGRTLMGCQRGQRGTTARDHDRRTGVRVGKTAVLMIKILHARDSWNG